MLNLSRVIVPMAVVPTLGAAVQAKEPRAASAKPQVCAQAVESVDFTLYGYV